MSCSAFKMCLLYSQPLHGVDCYLWPISLLHPHLSIVFDTKESLSALSFPTTLWFHEERNYILNVLIYPPPLIQSCNCRSQCSHSLSLWYSWISHLWLLCSPNWLGTWLQVPSDPCHRTDSLTSPANAYLIHLEVALAIILSYALWPLFISSLEGGNRPDWTSLTSRLQLEQRSSKH
jgi:hypothetical protein